MKRHATLFSSMVKAAPLIALLISSFLSVRLRGPSEAQNDGSLTVQPIERVTEEIAPVNLQWFDDGSGFAFLDAALFGRYVTMQTETDSWYVFDVHEQVLSRHSRWPFQPDIPAALVAEIMPDSLAFVSPESEFLIFASQSPQAISSSANSFVKLHDLKTGVTYATGIPAGIGATIVGFTSVTWGDGEHFVLSTTPDNVGLPTLPNFIYGTLIDGTVSAQQISVISLENKSFLVVRVFDVSSDGAHVLLEGGFVGEGKLQLAVWDALNPDELNFISETHIASGRSLLDAQFTTPQGSAVIFFSDQGIGRYDVTTATLQMLDERVTASDYKEAEFSPNAEMLVLADKTSVYWIDLNPTPVPY